MAQQMILVVTTEARFAFSHQKCSAAGESRCCERQCNTARVTYTAAGRARLAHRMARRERVHSRAHQAYESISTPVRRVSICRVPDIPRPVRVSVSSGRVAR